jgi:hypothetical protein
MLCEGDYAFCNELTKAAKITDPIERIKLIAVFFVGGNFINMSFGARIPLNPILGETLQRETPTGERLYAE